MNVSRNLCDGEHKFFFGNGGAASGALYKNSENAVKSGCFEKLLRWKTSFFSEMKEGYKVSCVKILTFR